MYPRQSVTTHTEQLGDEASVYDWANAQVHALNPTAACVWRLCDGATSPDAIAAVLQREMEIAEAEAVVKLTLTELAHRHLLEVPAESRDDRPAPTRRWLLGRGLKAAMLPAVYTILTPSPLEAQSPGGAPTLTSVTPNQGIQGPTVAVTLTGTNFVVGATTVNVSGTGVTVANVVVGNTTSLTANFLIDPTAAGGPRTVTVTTAAGASGAQIFTIIQNPAITSASIASFTVGTPGTFTVTTMGIPDPAISVSGTLPAGVTFVDNGNGTGTLSGTPAAGTGGTYPLSFTAVNSVGTATQSFTLTVNQAPP